MAETSLTYSIPEAGAMADLGRNASYAAAKRGEIPTMRFGRVKRVPAERWRKILSGEVEPPIPGEPSDAGVERAERSKSGRESVGSTTSIDVGRGQQRTPAD